MLSDSRHTSEQTRNLAHIRDEGSKSPKTSEQVPSQLHASVCESVLHVGGKDSAGINAVRWVNVYPDSNQLAIGWDTFIWNHGDLHRRAVEEYPNSGIPQSKDIKTYIGGWFDPSTQKLVLSLTGFGRLAAEAKTKHSVGRSASELTVAVASIETAISIAEKAGYTVLLQAETSEDKAFALILGRMHQTHNQDDLRPVDRVKHSVNWIGNNKLAGSIRVIYDVNRRTRYVLPEELQPLITCLDAREVFLEAIVRLKDSLYPDHHERRHAQFLLVDSSSGRILNSESALDEWNARVEQLATQAENPSEWDSSKEEIRSQLEQLIADLKEASDPSFHRIDPQNIRFSEVLARLLRGGEESLGLGSDFSTNLTPLPTGRFVERAGAHPEFIPDPAASDRTNAIARWVLENRSLPDGLSPDYICVLEPEGPLTVDHQTSRSLLDFGRIEPKAFVVIVGARSGGELRLVVRENMYAPHTWELRDTQAAAELLQQVSPQRASTLCAMFRRCQYQLVQTLANSIPGSRVSFASEYDQITIEEMPGVRLLDNFEVRPFINGTRLDKEDMSKWSPDHFAQTLSIVGELIAVAFVSQFTDLLDSDIVIDRRREGKTTSADHITFLSATGSFSNELGAVDRSEYLVKASRLYGNMIASWIERCLYHPSCIHLSREERDALSRTLIKECVTSFVRALKAIQRDEHGAIKAKMNEIQCAYQQESDVPGPLRLPTHLGLSRDLCSLKDQRINFVGALFTSVAHDRLNLISEIAPLPNNDSGDPEELEATRYCIQALCALMGNHIIETDMSRSIDYFIMGAPYRLPLLGPREKGWYFAVLDVAARLAELHFSYEQFKAVVTQATQSNDGDELYREFLELYPKMNLTPQLVCSFREACAGVTSELRRQPPGSPKATQLKCAFEDTKSLFKGCTQG